MADKLGDYLASVASTLNAAREKEGLMPAVESAIDKISEALMAKKPLLVCGNGGSASDAMHIAGELVGRFEVERKGLNVIALPANPSIVTAWANDYSYETVFSRQVEAYGDHGAVILGLSTSGNSGNVIAAFEQAREIGMTTIGMTGEGGGRMAGVCDILIDVPSKSTPRIQEVHICLYHFICQQVEKICAADAAH